MVAGLCGFYFFLEVKIPILIMVQSAKLKVIPMCRLTALLFHLSQKCSRMFPSAHYTGVKIEKKGEKDREHNK